MFHPFKAKEPAEETRCACQQHGLNVIRWYRGAGGRRQRLAIEECSERQVT